jgi:hypothetical protein
MNKHPATLTRLLLAVVVVATLSACEGTWGRSCDLRLVWDGAAIHFVSELICSEYLTFVPLWVV